jgi:hypothetical protein
MLGNVIGVPLPEQDLYPVFTLPRPTAAFGAKPAADLYFEFALRPSNESGAATFHA